MKNIILTASWFAVAVYCILAGVYGPAGLKATAQARQAASAMLTNIDQLEKLNMEYSLEWNALRSDAELIAVQGRSLGFIANDEIVVRLVLPGTKESPVFTGDRVLYDPAKSLTEPGIRAASLYLWLCIVLAGLARRLFGHHRNQGYRTERILRSQREIRVQEASRT
ncbi:MAG: septum formation initiator family protein [Spirochaetia bacterium]|jgi:cell division protein FtsB|nr:septum formation initiator family protein [Spirochaetia bacterium]